MRQQHVAFLLACVGILFAAVASAPAAIGVAPAAPDGTPALQSDLPQEGPDACPPLPPSAGDQFTPMACRRAPECSTDDDCTPLCGPTGGKCVHSSCPIRICKCH